MMRFYNTLSQKIEDFTPLDSPLVKYYSCGPTVYDFAHIGHARTYVFTDILQRVLEFNGYQIKRVMNITDVGHLTSDSDSGEDKMELASRRSGKGAKREKKTVWEIAKFYTDDFFRMLDRLNIKKPQIICRATDHINEMVKLIGTLEKKGFTYAISDGVYFDTAKFPAYGRLTGQTFSQLKKRLKAGARVELVAGKKHPTDFALWKFSPSTSSGLPRRQMEWDSPWGRGFPGWHIECSAMSMKYLGEKIDIHTGGIDHIPIHHTNEIAQSEAASGKPFVKYWLHAAHLLVEGQKMSKSLNNFYRLSDLEKKGFYPLSLRYLFLTAHYRQQMNFTWKGLESAQNALDSLWDRISTVRDQMLNKKRTGLSTGKLSSIDNFKNQFIGAVNNDLKVSQALALVWQVLKSSMPPGDKYDLLLLFDEILGLDLKQSKACLERSLAQQGRSRRVKSHKLKVPKEILDLVTEREKLRQEKKFLEADKVRKQIEEKGYFVEDIPTGPRVKSTKH